MDLVPLHDDFSSAFSTLKTSAERDHLPPASARADDHLEREFSSELGEMHWNALLLAAASVPRTNLPVVKAHGMDMVEAALTKQLYDKVLILVKHGQDESQIDANPRVNDPGLTARGIGQMHSLTRKVATFCNDETGLHPEVLVSAPLRRSIDTAKTTFNFYSPESIRSIPWLCHPDAKDVDETERVTVNNAEDVQIGGNESLVHAKQELLHRSDRFLEWLATREERVVVVSSQATWFQALGYSLHYDEAPTMLRNSEMRAIGLTFQ